MRKNLGQGETFSLRDRETNVLGELGLGSEGWAEPLSTTI